MPTLMSELSLDQLKHLSQKSVARAAKKYSVGFMQSALNESDRLPQSDRRKLVEMSDFGEALACWYGSYLFFTDGGWQRWIESHSSQPSAAQSATLRSSLAAKFFGKLRELVTG
jgi:hypothetical protein